VAYDIFAKGDSTGTGDDARLLGYQLKFYSQGTGAKFFVRDTDDGRGTGPDGTPDTVDIYNNPGDPAKSSIRPISTLTNGGAYSEPLPSNLAYQELWPTATFAQPSPWHSVRSFTSAVVVLRGAPLSNYPLTTAGRGTRLARIVVEQSESFWVSGTVADAALRKNAYFVGVGDGYDVPPSFGAGVLLSAADVRQTLTTSGDNPTIYSLSVDFASSTAPPALFSIDTNLTQGFIKMENPGWTPVVPVNPTGGTVITGKVNTWETGVFDIKLTGMGAGTDSAILRVTSRIVVPEPAAGFVAVALITATTRRPRRGRLTSRHR
jgi:hypothetical protein